MPRIFLNPPAVSKLLLACSALVLMSSPAAQAGVSVRKIYSTKEKFDDPFDKPRLGSFGSPSVNDQGQVAVVTSMYGPNTTNFTSLGVILGKNTGNAELVARRGPYLAPELDSPFNRTFPNPSIVDLDDYTVLNNRGQVIFSGTVTGSVKDKPNTPQSITPPVQITGDYIGVGSTKYLPSPFTPEFPLPKVVAFAAEGDLVDYFATFPVTFHEVNKEAAINNKGFVSFIGRSTNDNSFGQFNGIWYGRPAAAGSILTLGEVVHGLPFGSDYSGFGGIALADSGRAYTIATITNKGEGFYGIWAGNNGFMNPIVTRLTKKPDTETRFSNFTLPISVSRGGQVLAFPADGSLWTKKGSKLTQIAKPRDIIGKQSAVDRNNNVIQSFISGAAVNRKGQVAFLADTRFNDSVETALVVSKGKGEFEMITRVGSTLKVNGRTKEIINLELNEAGGLNNQGVVAFTASFSDRTSAVFVARAR